MKSNKSILTGVVSGPMSKLLLGSVLSGLVGLAAWTAFGLGANYLNGHPVINPNWPAGVTNLVNTTNRIGGYWVEERDWFFFSGTAAHFDAFLDGYSKIERLKSHRLVLHDGAGEAYLPGSGKRLPCDWELDIAPDMHRDTNYIMEVHFWTGGKIPLDKVAIPKNVEVAKAK